jgi:type IV pilus assembly protein PilV
MDIAASRKSARVNLPAGGMIVKCGAGVCSKGTAGEIWVVWQEPDTFAALSGAGNDNCPTEVTSTYTNPAPRCLYVRFKVE